MHRLGFSESQVDDLIDFLQSTNKVWVKTIMTHFSSSENEEDDDYTISQATQFDRIYDKVSNALKITPLKHACNSAAAVRWPQYHYDMIRLGIGLHGVDPSGSLQLQVVSQLKSVVSQIQHLSKGDTVGYSRSGKVDGHRQVATIPIGYEDGFLRHFGNGKGFVVINGHRFPTIGNICMDMIMVDVTAGDVAEGDEVTIFGKDPKVSELAANVGTISHEILTNVSSRVRRVFHSD
jgi:alanine racemase